MTTYKMQKGAGAGDSAQWLGALVALAKESRFIPSTIYLSICNSSVRGSNTHIVTHTGRTLMHMK